jgi:hypothetical protein
MTWKLWLDDQLDDPERPRRHTPDGFVGARSTEEAKELVLARGLPSFMDLDHDLGGDDKVMGFLRWLSDMYPDGPVPEYLIHSENPEGRKNIQAFLSSWKRSLPPCL